MFVVMYLVQFEVQSARVAHRAAVGTAAPECRLDRATVGARVESLEIARLAQVLVQHRLAGAACTAVAVAAAAAAAVAAAAATAVVAASTACATSR